MSDQKTAWKDYVPSEVGGIIAATLFGIVTIIHCWRLFRTKLWFCIPFIVGGLFEAIGYAARAVGHNNLYSTTAYIIQTLLILLAPILFAASIYMTLTRLMRACKGQHLSIVRVTWVTKIFVGGDILCFLIQGAGGGILANADTTDDYDRGRDIVLAGLVTQVLVFLFFMCVAAVFHYRMRSHGAKSGGGAAAALGFPRWQFYMGMLYLVSGLIAARNICRCIEYSEGQDGYLVTHEWCLYVYDFALMFLCLSICLVWYQLDMKKLLRESTTGAMLLPSYDPESGPKHTHAEA